jgi:hypothetical protein
MAGDTADEAIQAAYLAATATPPNPPLTREQVEAMPKMAAVWVYFSAKYYPMVMSARIATMMKHPIGSLFFAAPPTPADIKAAQMEKATGGQA